MRGPLANFGGHYETRGKSPAAPAAFGLRELGVPPLPRCSHAEAEQRRCRYSPVNARHLI